MKSTLLFFFLFFFYRNLTGQVVLNEIFLNDTYIELKNLSDTAVNVSQYWVVSGSESKRVGQYFPFCGGMDMVLSPGEILLNNALPESDWTQGEVALFVNDDFDNPDALIDYVQWGTSGHEHESLAVSANQWIEGDFVQAFLDGGSLEYDGEGNLSTDWTNAAVTSGCEENGTGCEVGVGTVFGSDPYTVCIGDGDIDGFSFSWTGNISEFQKAVLLDSDDRILAFSTEGFMVDVEDLLPEQTAGGLHVVMLGHNGPIGNLAPGVLLDDVVGCFAVSQPFNVEAYFVHQGDLTATYNDTVNSSAIELCATDGKADIVEFENSSEDELIAYVIFNSSNGRVVDITTNPIYDFEGIDFPLLRVKSFSFVDTIVGDSGDFHLFVHGNICSVEATNTIDIITNVCETSVSHVVDNRLISIFPNPSNNFLNISNLPAKQMNVYLFDATGSLIFQKPIQYQGSHHKLDITSLPTGMYLIHIPTEDVYYGGVFIKL